MNIQLKACQLYTSAVLFVALFIMLCILALAFELAAYKIKG